MPRTPRPRNQSNSDDQTPRLGIRTTNPSDKIALRGVRLRSRLTALCERTTIEQTFVNLEGRAIEAVYTFPLPDGAAVCGFDVITGDRVLSGEIDESTKAIEKYEKAINEGDGAFLMEQDRPDIFTIRVGNLKPRQAATIRLNYVRALTRVDREIRLSFPTTVAPRYVTDSGGRDPMEALIDGDAVNPPHALYVPYGLSMEVEVDLGREVKAISSPSHAIDVTNDADVQIKRIRLSGGVTEMNRDIVLSLTMAKDQRPSVQVGKWKDGDDYLAVTFMPEFDPAELGTPEPSEVIFLLDCSGSMQGESIEQATKALELCLRSMGKGDTFNICRFGSTFDLLYPKAKAYNAETLRHALKFIQRRDDLGGTELLAPLEAILEVPVLESRVRQVIVLTDGQISNEQEVIELASERRESNRIFTFGVGSSASAHLVNGLARASGGAAEFIAEGERIEDKVLRTFGRLASPQVSDVEIDWGGSDVQTLASIPPVFDGDSLAVYGHALGRAPTEVTLRCKTRVGPKEWTLPVGRAVEDDGAIALMWARRAIQSFEDVHAIRRPVTSEAEANDATRKLVSLSKDFGLLCSLTTFVAVEHRTLEERNAGRPALRRVPVMLAKGWGDVEGFCSVAREGPGEFYSVVEVDDDAWQPRLVRSRAVTKYSVDSVNRLDQPRRLSVRASAAPSRVNNRLIALLSSQSAEGAFGWDASMESLLPAGLNLSRQSVAGALTALAGGRSVTIEAIDTARVLVLLHARFEDDCDLWCKAAEKAMRFVADTLGVAMVSLKGWVEETANR